MAQLRKILFCLFISFGLLHVVSSMPYHHELEEGVNDIDTDLAGNIDDSTMGEDYYVYDEEIPEGDKEEPDALDDEDKKELDLEEELEDEKGAEKELEEETKEDDIAEEDLEEKIKEDAMEKELEKEIKEDDVAEKDLEEEIAEKDIHSAEEEIAEKDIHSAEEEIFNKEGGIIFPGVEEEKDEEVMDSEAGEEPVGGFEGEEETKKPGYISHVYRKIKDFFKGLGR